MRPGSYWIGANLWLWHSFVTVVIRHSCRRMLTHLIFENSVTVHFSQLTLRKLVLFCNIKQCLPPSPTHPTHMVLATLMLMWPFWVVETRAFLTETVEHLMNLLQTMLIICSHDNLLANGALIVKYGLAMGSVEMGVSPSSGARFSNKNAGCPVKTKF